MHKRTPHEEFWVTDFEIEDYNRTIRQPGMGEASPMPTPQKIQLEGIGFDPPPNNNNPILLQAGRRSGISHFFQTRNFPLEVNAYMIQGSTDA